MVKGAQKKYAKKGKKTGVKKQYRKKRFLKPNTISFTKTPGGFGDRAYVVLKHASVMNDIEYTGASNFTQLYDLNGTDNIVSATGWDQYSQVYNSGVIRWCAIKFRVYSLGSNVPCRVTVFPFNYDVPITSYSPSNVADLLEQPYRKSKMLGSIVNSPFCTVNNFIGSGKMSAIVPKSSSSDMCFFTGSTNSTVLISQPNSLLKWACRIDTLNGQPIPEQGMNQTGLYYDVELTYGVEFYEKLLKY